MRDDLWLALWFHFRDLAAGLAGAVVNCLYFKRSKPADVIRSLLAGTIMAIWLGPAVSDRFGTTREATGFVIGVMWMAICQLILDAAGSRKLLKRLKND
jgi:hypothetical protein